MLTPNSVKITWDQSPDATGYLISCTTKASYASDKNVIENSGDTTSHTFSDLVENTPYEITVQGITGDGKKSEHSTTVSIATQKTGKLYEKCTSIEETSKTIICVQ